MKLKKDREELLAKEKEEFLQKQRKAEEAKKLNERLFQDAIIRTKEEKLKQEKFLTPQVNSK